MQVRTNKWATFRLSPAALAPQTRRVWYLVQLSRNFVLKFSPVPVRMRASTFMATGTGSENGSKESDSAGQGGSILPSQSERRKKKKRKQEEGPVDSQADPEVMMEEILTMAEFAASYKPGEAVLGYNHYGDLSALEEKHQIVMPGNHFGPMVPSHVAGDITAKRGEYRTAETRVFRAFVCRAYADAGIPVARAESDFQNLVRKRIYSVDQVGSHSIEGLTTIVGLGGATGATCATGATGATGVTVTFFAVTGGGTMDWLDCIFISLERRSVATFDGSLVAGGGGGAF